MSVPHEGHRKTTGTTGTVQRAFAAAACVGLEVDTGYFDLPAGDVELAN